MIIWADMLVLVVFAAITLVAGNFRQRLLSILINLGFYSVAGYQWSNGDAIGPQISMLASGLACTLLLAAQSRGVQYRMLAYTATSMMVSSGLLYWVLHGFVQPSWNGDVSLISNEYSDMIMLKCYFTLSTAAHSFWLVMCLVTIPLHLLSKAIRGVKGQDPMQARCLWRGCWRAAKRLYRGSGCT